MVVVCLLEKRKGPGIYSSTSTRLRLTTCTEHDAPVVGTLTKRGEYSSMKSYLLSDTSSKSCRRCCLDITHCRNRGYDVRIRVRDTEIEPLLPT
jgi:hypothetical protein